MTQLILTDHRQTKMSKGLLLLANVCFTPFIGKKQPKIPYGGKKIINMVDQLSCLVKHSLHNNESIDSPVANQIKPDMNKKWRLLFHL